MTKPPSAAALLNRMLIVNQRHLELVLAEYVDHLNGYRPTGLWINKRRIALKFGCRRQPQVEFVGVIGSTG